jgi:hypothetical protein
VPPRNNLPSNNKIFKKIPQLKFELFAIISQTKLPTRIFFHIHTVLHLDTIKVFYSPTDAQVNCLKNNFKIYIKIDTKTVPTYFGAITPSSGNELLVLAKVTVVKIAN